MVAEKYFAFVLILCGLSAINTDVVLPRKHFIDWATFDSQVGSIGEYKWKAMWVFTVNPTSTVEFTYGPEYRFEVQGNTMVRFDRFININNGMCSTFFDDSLPYLQQNDSVLIKTKRFATSPDEYLAFFSSTPTKYVWMYACNRLVSDTCSEDETDIQLLYNQDETYNRPEGIPWDQALKDLRQATKLTLDESRTGMFGTWRAAYKYKPINNRNKNNLKISDEYDKRLDPNTGGLVSCP